MSSESDSVIPTEIEEIANAAINNLLPVRSKEQYERTYNLFRNWCATKKVNKITEIVILAYLEEKSSKLKGSTLWSIFSMLKATLNVKDNIDLRKFPKLVPYLKHKTVGYHAKKSEIFTRQDVTKFLEEADDITYLFMKVVLIMGLSGACRREELVKMTTDDMQDMNTILIIKVPDTKTHSDRTFTITNLNYIELYRKYFALRPKHTTTNRLFLKYSKGKCVNQPVGLNKMGTIPSLIADYLGKDLPKNFTGHCFRRTSATLLVNAGGNMTCLKRHGGWKSTSAAEGYIEESIQNKIDISNKISNCEPSTSHTNEITINNPEVTSQTVATSFPSSGFIITNCTNCTINLTITK